MFDDDTPNLVDEIEQLFERHGQVRELRQPAFVVA